MVRRYGKSSYVIVGPRTERTLRVATAGEKIRKPSRLDRQNTTISPRGWRGI